MARKSNPVPAALNFQVVTADEVPARNYAGRPPAVPTAEFLALREAFEAIGDSGNALRLSGLTGAEANGMRSLARKVAASFEGVGTRVVIETSDGDRVDTMKAADLAALDGLTIYITPKPKRGSKTSVAE